MPPPPLLRVALELQYPPSRSREAAYVEEYFEEAKMAFMATAAGTPQMDMSRMP